MLLGGLKDVVTENRHREGLWNDRRICAANKAAHTGAGSGLRNQSLPARAHHTFAGGTYREYEIQFPAAIANRNIANS
jgi:hypothetical protein